MSDFEILSAAVAAWKRERRVTAEAKAKVRVVRNATLADPERIEPRALFTDPANWLASRGIALIHEETQTLLGNFREFTHRTEAGCRRLVHEAAPIAIDATELTDWLPTTLREEPTRAEPWHTRQTAILPLHLERLGVQTPLAEVIAHLSYGNVARVELAVETQFFAAEGAPEQLLWLRAGINILPVLSQDTKINLRIELARPLT